MLKLTATLLLASTLAVSAHAAAPAEDLQAYAGQYALADGRVLTIADDAGNLTAQIVKRAPTMQNSRFSAPRTVALKPAGLGRFTSASSPLEVTFAHDARGDVAQVSLTEQGAAMQGLALR